MLLRRKRSAMRIGGLGGRIGWPKTEQALIALGGSQKQHCWPAMEENQGDTQMTGRANHETQMVQGPAA